MKAFITAAILFLACSTVSAQQLNLITNIDARNTTSLNGKWRFIIDPFEYGYLTYRLTPSKDGFFINQKPKDKTDLVEYDFDESEQLNVPGDWNSQMEKLLLYEGTIWYKKSFDYNKKPNTRLFIYFGAVNYMAHVYLNGEKIGEHEGGFTPFNFEITDKVKDKGNFLILKVDNVRRRDGVPTVNSDWWNYGGITRDVYLVETPDTFIQDYFIQLKKGSTEQISGWARLSSKTAQQKVIIKIPEAGLEKTFTTGPDGLAEVNMSGNFQLWCPEHPKLYEVIIASETDRVIDHIGFRTIETRGTDILLNGKPVFLRGVCIHEEAPYRAGRAFSREDAVTLLGWAREMGCNFVRLAHYPHNENMTRVADELGLMVWSEVPVYWTILWDNPSTFANASKQLTEMITRDKNRASIILWSMANETPPGEARLSFLRRMAEQAKQLDPTRLTTAAMEREYTDAAQTAQLIADPFGEYVDVLGCNEYVGWYDGLPEKCDRMTWKSAYNKPLIMSEFGGSALYGHHGDEMTRWTEEYQENMFQRQIAMLKKIPFLRGTTPWILMDFRSPRRQLPHIQDGWNRKGLVSDQGRKKKAFFIMKKFYEEKMER